MKKERELKKSEIKQIINERVNDIIKKHNNKAKESAVHKKRKSYVEMIELLGDFYKPEHCIRDPKDWKNTAYNEDRQLISFIKHIYCKYKVPSFMFGMFDKSNIDYRTPLYRVWNSNGYSIRDNIGMLFEWFIIAATGRPFAKELSDFFSKKEAHIFLNGLPNLSIYSNYWRAKLIAAGATEETATMCIGVFPYDDVVAKPYMYEAAKFFPRFQEDLDPMTLLDVMSFVDNSARDNAVNRVPQFSFKGRTLKSLIKASVDWHREQKFKVYGDIEANFPKCKIDDWSWVNKDDGCTWYVRQILNSKTLCCEGRAMKHCVATYSSRCTNGDSTIFSLSNSVEGRKLTIELNKYLHIVQARGRFNAQPKGKERKVLESWVKDNGLKFLYKL